MKVNLLDLTKIPVLQLANISCPVCKFLAIQVLDCHVNERRIYRCENCRNYFIENVEGKLLTDDYQVISSTVNDNFEVK